MQHGGGSVADQLIAGFTCLLKAGPSSGSRLAVLGLSIRATCVFNDDGASADDHLPLIQEFMMNRFIAVTALALSLTFTAIPASAVVYCKTVGVPKGCVARPSVPVAGAVTAPRPGNANGGVNRAGVRR